MRTCQTDSAGRRHRGRGQTNMRILSGYRDTPLARSLWPQGVAERVDEETTPGAGALRCRQRWIDSVRPLTRGAIGRPCPRSRWRVPLEAGTVWVYEAVGRSDVDESGLLGSRCRPRMFPSRGHPLGEDVISLRLEAATEPVTRGNPAPRRRDGGLPGQCLQTESPICAVVLAGAAAA